MKCATAKCWLASHRTLGHPPATKRKPQEALLQQALGERGMDAKWVAAQARLGSAEWPLKQARRSMMETNKAPHSGRPMSLDLSLFLGENHPWSRIEDCVACVPASGGMATKLSVVCDPISLGDIHNMPTRSKFAIFQDFLNFWSNAPKRRYLGGGGGGYVYAF